MAILVGSMEDPSKTFLLFSSSWMAKVESSQKTPLVEFNDLSLCQNALPRSLGKFSDVREKSGKMKIEKVVILVGSMEAPSKTFLLLFLLAEWLKLNHLKSWMECGFSEICFRHNCSTTAETIDVRNYTASFGAKNVQKTTFDAAEMMPGSWNQQSIWKRHFSEFHDFFTPQFDVRNKRKRLMNNHPEKSCLKCSVTFIIVIAAKRLPKTEDWNKINQYIFYWHFFVFSKNHWSITFSTR